ncbi:MAG TPA: DUF2889 domain-containing protein [Acidimicrobiales bacterium]|nr:DUF2889 domain-containing protein [Acidimicrobiales bacterium]
MERVPIHRRTIEFEAFEEGDEVVVTGRLRDDRPWAAGTAAVEHLHDMSLEITVRPEDLVITAATAVMHRFPHAECPTVEPDMARLVGLRVGGGYTRAVQERFGGALGCTHLDQLARTMGPVVIQAVTSRRARRRDWESLATEVADQPRPFPLNTCHIWVKDGPAEQKLAAGWRPGAGGYPAPPVAVVLRMQNEAPSA